MSSDEVIIYAGVSAAEVAAQLRRIATSHADTYVAQPDDHFAFSIGDAGGIFMGPDEDSGEPWCFCITAPGYGVELLQALADRFPWRLEAYDDDGKLLASRPALDATA